MPNPATLADVQAENAALAAAVSAEDTVVDSAIVLINGLNGKVADLSKQLADAIAAQNPAAIQAVSDNLEALTADLTAKTTSLATAIGAGTPNPPATPTVAVAPTPVP